MTSVITGKTRVLGIIGCPVAHSLSPLMQNAALEALGLDYIYVPFPVESAGLPAAVAGLRHLGVAGFNVTIPHKTAILPLLDGLSAEAELIGAVNTVNREGNRFIGHNTDAAGFLRSLREDLAFTPEGAHVLLIGAGGAASAALAALAEARVASVTIANRTRARGEELLARFRGVFPGANLALASLDEFAAEDFLRRFDLLVNSTSIGMNGTSFAGLDLGRMRHETCVYDMVYAPAETPLLAGARKHGLTHANGAGMLAAQGEAAFTIWTGCNPPYNLMKTRLLTALYG